MELGMTGTSRLRKVLRILVLTLVGITVVFPFYILLIESLHPNLVTMPYPIELWPQEISLSNYVYLFQKNPLRFPSYFQE